MSTLDDHSFMKSLSPVERKEYEELKAYHSDGERKKRETSVFYGYCVVAIVSVLITSGLLNMNGLHNWLR